MNTMPPAIAGPGPSSEPPRAGDAVDASVRPTRVEVPQDRAVGRRIGAHVAVDRSGEHHAGDRADRGRLRRAAARPIAASGRRRIPDALAGVERAARTCRRPASDRRRWRAVGQHDPADVRQRHVDVRPSAAEPHCTPPIVPPSPTRVCQSTSPSVDPDRARARCRTSGRRRARAGRSAA